MAKKSVLNFVIIVITLLLCVGVILFVALPHHTVTKADAIELASDYFNYRMEDSLKIEAAYVEGHEEAIFLEKIIDYWNPTIKHYEVRIRAKSIDPAYDSTFVICVDTFTGYVYDGSEGIRWKRKL